MKTTDLLTSRVFGVRIGDGEDQQTNLPGVLARLGAGKDVVFTGLQAYQDHAWHSFLVYLAAACLHAEKVDSPAQTETWWREALISLSKQPEWPLVEPNLKKPGFFQYPVPEDFFNDDEEGKKFLTPDEADTIPTNANHSRKRRICVAATPELWVYALVSLQGQSVSISKYRATSRSTSSGRVCVTLAPSLSLGDRFVRDVGIALAERARLVKTYDFRARGGKVLLWLDAWRGDVSLTPENLDPMYIDAPRVIRIRQEGDRLAAYRRPTDEPRVKIAAGGGDLWTPLEETEGGKAQSIGLGTLDERSFSLTTGYDKITRLLFGPKTIKSPCTRYPIKGSGYLIASGLLAINGKTFGYHNRTIPIDGQYVEELTKANADSQIAQFSVEHVKVAADTGKMVSEALWAVMFGGRAFTSKNIRDRYAKHHDQLLAQYSRRIDDEFFLALFRRVRGESPVAWLDFTVHAANATIDAASANDSHRSGRYYRGLAEATHLLDMHQQNERRRLNTLLGNETNVDDEERITTTTLTKLDDVVSKIHGYIVGLGHRDRGALASLRHLDVLNPSGEAVFKIESLYIDTADLPPVATSDREKNRRWMTVVRAAALASGLHKRGFAAGAALAKARLSPQRFERLLHAESTDDLDATLNSTVRFLSSKQLDFSLSELAHPYLWPMSDETRDVRRKIAKDFYLTSTRT